MKVYSCILIIIHFFVSTSLTNTFASNISTKKYNIFKKAIIKTADFIVALQDKNGAIKDSSDGYINEDSTMEYGLIGLAAAYHKTNNAKYLTALKKGIKWLAKVQNKDGSWYIAYNHNYLSETPSVYQEDSIEAIKGVASTNSLFVYNLYLYTYLSKDKTLAVILRKNSEKALIFILKNNYDAKDGYFRNSYQKRNGRWYLWPVKYSADQADCYLGLMAGYRLYGNPKYLTKAKAIKENFNSIFFDKNKKIFKVGIDEKNQALDDSGFNEYFVQGYAPWVFGNNKYTKMSIDWLRKKQNKNGGIEVKEEGRVYSLTTALYALNEKSLKEKKINALNYLFNTAQDKENGGVKDSSSDSALYSNVAAFSILSWTNSGTSL
ncbi:MAG: hypothetical protein HY776_04845 [Actinobacteria bacterium]|nr:hypothetical protein [Actinomycetota bacterium]